MNDKVAEESMKTAVESELVQEARTDKLKKEDEVELENDERQEVINESKKRSLDEVDTEQNDKAKLPKKDSATVVEKAKADEPLEESPEIKATKMEPLTEPNTQAEEANADAATASEPKADSKKEAPKFVFGSTTSFGTAPAFNLFGNKKNVFDEKAPEKEGKTEKSSESSETTKTDDAPKSVFGGGSTFGNAFQSAIKKKSIFEQDADTAKEKEPEAESETKDSTPTRDSVYQKVHLEKKVISTGEEEEETLFAVKSKLYTLDLTNVKEGWKEKGVGVLRLNKSIDSKSRLVMRADAILKVILNVPITPNFEVFKGMESSLNGEKFLRFNFIENDKPVQYALKFGQAENTAKLYDLIKDLS